MTPHLLDILLFLGLYIALAFLFYGALALYYQEYFGLFLLDVLLTVMLPLLFMKKLYNLSDYLAFLGLTVLLYCLFIYPFIQHGKSVKKFIYGIKQLPAFAGARIKRRVFWGDYLMCGNWNHDNYRIAYKLDYSSTYAQLIGSSMKLRLYRSFSEEFKITRPGVLTPTELRLTLPLQMISDFFQKYPVAEFHFTSNYAEISLKNTIIPCVSANNLVDILNLFKEFIEQIK